MYDQDQEQKHMCKFCYKTFHCGRSLGGHMRSHMINVSPSDHRNHDDQQKLPKKKLPPLTNSKNIFTGSGQISYGLRDHPRKTNKSSLRSSEEDNSLTEKHCKECGKSFQSWRALFGHMKCHSDSWNNVVDSQSDNDASGAPFRMKKKRSERIIRRYMTNTNSYSSLSNLSPCVSETDEQEQEELVALSLILLSKDTGTRDGLDSVVESSDNSSQFLESKKITKNSKVDNGECLKFKKLRNGKPEPTILNSGKRLMKKLRIESSYPDIIPRNELKTSRSEDKNLDCNEREVNSPKNWIKKSDRTNEFGSESNKNRSRKRKSIDSKYSRSPHDGPSDCENSQHFDQKSNFMCVICKKGFPSYQALGGHRASHKKFKGLCAPTSENGLEDEKTTNLSGVLVEKIETKKNKEHECPICFKVFPSGQAFGGHKRSHLIGDFQAKSSTTNSSSVVAVSEKPVPESRDFLDLNLPAPVEEECNEFKSWWIGTSQTHKLEPLLGLLL